MHQNVIVVSPSRVPEPVARSSPHPSQIFHFSVRDARKPALTERAALETRWCSKVYGTIDANVGTDSPKRRRNATVSILDCGNRRPAVDRMRKSQCRASGQAGDSGKLNRLRQGNVGQNGPPRDMFTKAWKIQRTHVVKRHVIPHRD